MKNHIDDQKVFAFVCYVLFSMGFYPFIHFPKAFPTMGIARLAGLVDLCNCWLNRWFHRYCNWYRNKIEAKDDDNHTTWYDLILVDFQSNCTPVHVLRFIVWLRPLCIVGARLVEFVLFLLHLSHAFLAGDLSFKQNLNFSGNALTIRNQPNSK